MFLPWLALQGLAFWLPWFWRIQDRSWRDIMPALVIAMTDSNWVSSRCQCIGCTSGREAGWLWFGTLTTNLHFPSTLFCHIYQMDNWRAWMVFVFFFLPLDVFELLSTSPQNHIWLWYFALFSNFWFCFTWLLQYGSSSCAVSNSAEGGDVKSKSLFVIHD